MIDGQHRLFGYSNSQYKSTNTIPVVALVNLGRSEQVKIFMQINENQKSVGKDLQNTLNAEILWSSDKLQEKLIALKSKIAINLGENRLSPFFDKISIGEDKKLISTDAIIRGLKRTDFFGKVKKNVLELKGTFFFGDLDRAYQEISDYLFSAFGLLKERLEITWNDKDNLVVSNRGFLGIILAMNDIVNYLLELKQISSNSTPKIIFENHGPTLKHLPRSF
ncbi:MAG: hypothetical protein IPP17_30585 [Bacteroidetes bacterium]|nr:hypothetical protein [Bacteroidota bacterium]